MEGWSPRLYQAKEEEKYVCRMKKHMPEKFRDMCNMHLAFILNLSDDKLEAILDAETSTGRKRLTLAPIFKKKVKTGSGLFGSPVSNESICLMTPLIKILSRKENISKEGLFRKPGNRQRMRKLREALNTKGPGVEIDPTVYNAYDIAGVLKEFLRDLPEPLLSDKHMEAHRQINALGEHAITMEDKARYSAKKLSALQLLMQLLPGPLCRMTNMVLTLLNVVSNTSETKMTPNTLATIFAPIFLLDRKVSATDVCEAVKEAEPALTLMIENAAKLFKVPKELAVDIRNYWMEMEASPHDIKYQSNTKLSHSYKIRKSISGRTLNTAVCYIDREQCKNVDIANHTQAELNNLFAHVQALPDTPSNQRIKDLMARRSRTPASSGGRHSRSKSIGASIRKILPYSSKSKAKSLDISVQSCATPYSTSKCNESTMSDLLKCSDAHLSSTTSAIAQSISLCTQSSSSPAVTRQRALMTRKRSSPDIPDYEYHCTPPKQERRIYDTDIVTATQTDSCQSYTERASFSSINDTIILPHDENNDTCDSFSISESPMTLKIRNKQSSSLPSLCVATPQEVEDSLNSPFMTGESENEINYIPITLHNKEKGACSPQCHQNGTNILGSPLSRRPLRPCNAPGTPIMPRAVLQIPRYTFETSL